MGDLGFVPPKLDNSIATLPVLLSRDKPIDMPEFAIQVDTGSCVEAIAIESLCLFLKSRRQVPHLFV